jgi:quercetin dioxygenase-like cupin family protein
MQPGTGLATLSRGDLRLLLNRPGAGGAGKPLPDREGGGHLPYDLVTGRGGSQILLEDPSGNPIKLFQPGGARTLVHRTRTLKGAQTMPSVPNLTTNVLLRSEQTGGHVSVTEIVVPPHTAGPPLHTHDFDEAFYMLEGELIFQVDDALVKKGAGELSFAARNVAHTLANHSDGPARYVLVCTPAGFERHWARVAADAAGVEPPQWALQPIPEVTVVGPQIAAQT